MQVLRWIVGFVLFIALLFLALQNSDTVTLKFYHWWSWQGPLIFIVLVAFALGVAAGLLTGVLRTSRLKRQINRMRRDHARDSRFMSSTAPTDGLRGAAPGTTVPPDVRGPKDMP